NGVDLEYFRPTERDRESGPRLVFVGVMDYQPNVDAVQWFCREILPRIRQEVSDVALTICGARPTQAVLDLGRLPGVQVTGAVPDVRPHMADAAVAVIPVRTARGIQNKVLE